MSQLLTFGVLDDLILAMESGRAGDAKAAASEIREFELGALVEYVMLERQGCRVPLSYRAISIDCVSVDAEGSNRAMGNTLQARDLEFRGCPEDSAGFTAPSWTAYCKRLELAARAAGFTNSFAAGICGAFVEMADNVAMHSDAIASSVSAYRWKPREFECVVADSGIGVLASLKKCREFALLRDHGDALLAAVTQGATRFGTSSGHGHGFRNLFARLASQSGALRFRSGDHALVVEGEHLDRSVARRLQRPQFSGLSVSIRCRL